VPVQKLRVRFLIPSGVFVLVFLLYLLTLAPSITWQHDGYDAGDLITAAYSLGIPHPTGYPTYMLVGHIFTRIPVGDIAYRMNLLSALCAALAVTACYTISTAAPGAAVHSSVAALSAGLWLAASRLFWSQAIITEVYALNVLFFTAVVGLTLAALAQTLDGKGSIKRMRVLGVLAPLALVYGLSLGNHLIMLLCVPMLLYLGISVARRHVLQAADWLLLGGLFMLGLCVYAYLPLRAGKQPLSNWGNPRKLQGFLWVVGGGIYRQFVFGLPLAYWPQRCLSWVHLLVQQFGPLGALLGLLGIGQEWRCSPRRTIILLMTAGLYSVYAILYNTTDSYVYLLPVYVIFSLWLARGARFVIAAVTSTRRTRSAWPTALTCILLVALPLLTLALNLPNTSLRHDRAAYDYGRQVLAQVPDRCIIFSNSDPHSFTLWYFAQVVTGRTLVAIVDRDLLGYDWYIANLRQAYPWLRFPSDLENASVTVERLAEANRRTANIYWADVDEDTISQQHLQLDGLLYR